MGVLKICESKWGFVELFWTDRGEEERDEHRETMGKQMNADKERHRWR